MKCPFCGYKEDKVVDSRATAEESAIRRRRECLKCGKRFTTYEYIEEVSLMVIKKDGRREPFDRKKVLAGIIRACEKRPISVEKMEDIVTFVERAIQKKSDREVLASRIGELVMEKLKALDDVAYVRFASVYRQFKDVGQFMVELKDILGKDKKKK
ncbi:MAG: transcriptional regulator NrdR [Candidatus Omnitrophica bacterium CG08_land_8_20_14_0_20_41_16]|uniref:Transcriptional repressor NrdR n=1 Tax=Candidatus Sherwoodlollariibacterium unditelluris TaxID=1974757 RepID=A0A2G9YL19_9BACT|nr:MAG: transcriptional regulator NrdR [Candidatus Omnitrophica bacterium CG23_combo_of_CG06-09_8_20_14_all_41_10]PIS33945.1 MAG: transcriptional regulator NrdR [Candidatus Omnitrophica bacterium CG08_land_8_20_14_0_20_41_16]